MGASDLIGFIIGDDSRGFGPSQGAVGVVLGPSRVGGLTLRPSVLGAAFVLFTRELCPSIGPSYVAGAAIVAPSLDGATGGSAILFDASETGVLTLVLLAAGVFDIAPSEASGNVFTASSEVFLAILASSISLSSSPLSVDPH